MQKYLPLGEAQFAFPMVGPGQLWQPAMQAIGAWNETVGPAIAKCQRGYWDFIQHRVEADCSFAQRLSQCKTPEEVFDTYAGFWATVAEDYQKQIKTSVELAASFAKAGVSAVPATARS